MQSPKHDRPRPSLQLKKKMKLDRTDDDIIVDEDCTSTTASFSEGTRSLAALLGESFSNFNFQGIETGEIQSNVAPLAAAPLSPPVQESSDPSKVPTPSSTVLALAEAVATTRLDVSQQSDEYEELEVPLNDYSSSEGHQHSSQQRPSLLQQNIDDEKKREMLLDTDYTSIGSGKYRLNLINSNNDEQQQQLNVDDADDSEFDDETTNAFEEHPEYVVFVDNNNKQKGTNSKKGV